MRFKSLFILLQVIFIFYFKKLEFLTKNFIEETIYYYLFILAFIAGALSAINKRSVKSCKTIKCKIHCFIFNIATSILTGYIGFEISEYFFNHDKLSLAIACVCSWLGVDLLNEVKEKLFNILNEIKKDDFKK